MELNILKTGILLAFIALFGIVNVNAQSGERGSKKPPTTAEIFKELDTNEDGKLSESEVKGPLKDDFSTIDTNKDGFISKEEFETAPKPTRKKKRRVS